jgi:hypothetical protein
VAIVITLGLVLMGALSFAGGTYIKDNVTDQLTSQKIAFAPVGSDGLPQDITKYGGTQVVNGAQAKVFADDYIETHVQASIREAEKANPSLAGVTTYSGVSSASRANPDNEQLSALVQSVFRGEMLRASLLNSWGWWTFGVILFWIGIGAFALGGLIAASVIFVRTPVGQKVTHSGDAGRGHPTPA